MKHTKKVKLTNDFKKEIIYNSLCNGLSQITHWGYKFDFIDEHYNQAKQQLKAEKPNEEICIEDILMKILLNDNPIYFFEEDDIPILIDINENLISKMYLKDCLKNLDNLPNWVVAGFLIGNDDSEQADIVLQFCIFGEVIFD